MKVWLINQCKCLLVNCKAPSNVSRAFSTKVNSKNVEQQANPNEKLVKLAIIGIPNSGKSTFINNLINHRVCPTSSKVHTTRSWSKAITVRQNSQIIIFDTPGLVTQREMKKHRLDAAFISSSRHSIQHADLIGVVHDISNSWTRNAISPVVLDLLKHYSKIPSFLILNKIDLLKSKRVLLDVIKLLTEDTLGLKRNKKTKPVVSTLEVENLDADRENAPPKVQVGWPHFEDVFMVSSLTGDGLNKVMDFVQSHSRTSQWEFAADQCTDRKPEEIIVQSVQARLLDYLPQEIPYLLNCEIEYFSNENGIIYASVLVKCPNSRLERLMCGVSNGKLKQINERVTSDLVETFKAPVHLTITSVVSKKAD